MDKPLHSAAAEPHLSPSPLPALPAEDGNAACEEPALSDVTGLPPGAAYAALLKTREEEQTAVRAGLTLLFCALAAGPFAVVGAFMRGGGGAGVLGPVVFAPLVEEFAKIATPLIVLERCPWRWTRGWQLVFVCAVSGLVFAAVENLLYQHVYLDNPSAELLRWRWTICVLMHTGCSTIAGLGLRRAWRETRLRRTRPDAALPAPYVITAIVLHGAYNALAVALSLLGVM
ncbi:MAG: PrsW family intramembrane metalloprotease [Kiritimatiellaeota bacterium]|nr:PrsW family intramembrane metalloprotease [Kiritimatiellota bacterium]